ncbi:secretion-regulating guanine nucleotide exchange factor isoform X3 [Erpetoichthys calabaricus]|uniref:secretion-regulating guanine nucleotide exchange factor isoform X3 n=1 Tax=Erpetoichthys calabaricus TaxID=27687 RepID=UPI00109FA117|nr:secretion-regulating guanine nucleotide exchange factor isoform X3 [Erpetoichthys calabaricus]
MTAKKELRGGLLFAWGANSYGQLGLGHKEDVLLPVRVTQGLASIGNIKCLVGGGGHSAIITELGELLLCGHNHKGQLGMGHKQEVLYFCCCPSLQGRIVVQVACGWDFTLILTDDGTIWTCGSNAFGQLGLPQHLGESTLPLPIETLNGNAVEIAAGLRHALAVTAEKGLVFQWGVGMKSLANRGLQTLPVPAFMSAREPYEVPGLGHVKVKHVSAGAYHSACITDEGCLFVWGSNKYGQLPSSDDFLPLPFFIQPHHFEGEKVTLVCSGWTHMVARTEKGQVYTCGRADYGQLGRKIKSIQDSMCKSNVIQSRFTPEKVSELTGASQITCGSEHSLAAVGNSILSWGWNEHGMCGDGTEVNICEPKQISFFHNYIPTAIGTGAGHSMALCRAAGQSGGDFKGCPEEQAVCQGNPETATT